MGLAAIIVACFCSAFAGIYFEIIVKTSPVSLWVRNIQLGSFGFLIALASVLINDFQAVRDDGFFQGYDTIVWCAVAQHVIFYISMIDDLIENIHFSQL